MEVSVHDASDQLRKQVNDLQNQVLALKQPSAAAGRVARTISNGATPEMVKTVLWVDNEPRRNAHEIAKLEEDGYLVIQARSTSEGRSILRSGTEPDAIITDMGRKEDGKYIADAGLELIRAVREERIEALIFVYTNLRHVRRICTDVLEAGGNGTIASPLDLFAAVENGA
jgi:CheY-like chemotaxis protein